MMKKICFLMIVALFALLPFGIRVDAQSVSTTLFPSQCGVVATLWPSTNYFGFEDFIAISWTNQSNPGTDRSFMQFDFSGIPGNATIDSALLSLYWYVSASNIGHSTMSGSNISFLQRCIAPWSAHTVTWNNQPAVTATNEVVLPMTSNDTEDYPNINILPLVQDMMALGNNGFAFRLATESYYRSMLFASSYVADSSLRPRLRIVYHIPYTITPVLQLDPVCAGSSFAVPYTAVGNFIAGNTFIAQLSDSMGSFLFPLNIGSIASTTSGIISATIPQNTMGGHHYRIRVVANNPVIIGSDNGIDIVVVANPIPVITANGNTTICPGDSVLLTASVAMNYLWNNLSTTQSMMVHSAGYYFVITTNASGCSAQSNLMLISYHSIPNPLITANGPLIFCAGDSVTLTTVTAMSYLWNTGATTQGITVDSAGTYRVSITDISGCTGVSANTIVAIDIPPIPIITYNGNLLASSSAYGNQWLLNGAPIAGATGFIYTAPVTGCYSVQVTDSIGCVSVSDTVCITINHNGINEINAINDVLIFPNPIAGIITIRAFRTKAYEVRIKDVVGQLLYSKNSSNNGSDETISLPLNDGIYFIELSDGGAIFYQGKVVVIQK